MRLATSAMASLSRDEPKYQVPNFSIFLTKLTNYHLKRTPVGIDLITHKVIRVLTRQTFETPTNGEFIRNFGICASPSPGMTFAPKKALDVLGVSLW
ncbi:hypothetical protein E2C01_055992 [Portunus trituberculatus]|uniref:Uncharacterized protein n=1 Tax=Portunus trituberculatus TaxID=210409 RepID=A0A5B7GX21_PORTR|nr:hypothetical protein [Portunus trituberculatus]